MIEFAGRGQVGQEFVINPIDENDPEDVIPLDLTDYKESYICIKQPDGTITEHVATVKPGISSQLLVGRRIDLPGLTLDGSNINDGNDGSGEQGTVSTINLFNLNSSSVLSYIEIPPSHTLIMTSGRDYTTDVISLWGFTYTGVVNMKGYITDTTSETVSVTNLVDHRNNFTFSQAVRYNGLEIENTSTTQTIRIYRMGDLGGGKSNLLWRTGDLTTVSSVKPFTFVVIKKNETLILQNDLTYIPSSNRKLYFYFKGSAYPYINIQFFNNDILQGVQRIEGISFPIELEPEFIFDELRIEVLDQTNGNEIQLGGISEHLVSEDTTTSITTWRDVYITSSATNAFDGNLETYVPDINAFWFVESIGEKTITAIALTRPTGTVDNPDVVIELLINGVYEEVFRTVPAITDGTPILLPINNIPRNFQEINITSTEPYRLHQLSISGDIADNFQNASITYQDNDGILNQTGLVEFWAKVVYNDGTSKTTYTHGALMVK